MPNETITNNDIGSVLLGGDAVHEDAPITFAGADTFVEGTILSRNNTTQKFVPFVKGGTANVNAEPEAVLTYDITATGAGDIQARVLVNGKVRKERLVIDADGDDSNIDGNVRDQLRAAGITAVDVAELGQLDNQ